MLHSFTGGLDGRQPLAGLIQGTDGYFYGTAPYSGAYDWGIIFRLSGLYPLPVLTAVNPTFCNAGGPAFILTVQGTGFQSFSTVHWNGAPLSTSYVSVTTLTAVVPASLIAMPGKATLTVVTGAGGGTSNVKKLPIWLTKLRLISAIVTRNTTTGVYTANISLKNSGYQSAAKVLLKKTTLGTATTSASLPQSLGTLAAGATGATLLTFPASAGSSGTAVRLTVTGSFTGGSFYGSVRVILP